LSESPSSKETDVKKSRFNETQIIGVLREQEGGADSQSASYLHYFNDLIEKYCIGELFRLR
jgi:hypothetical protein